MLEALLFLTLNVYYEGRGEPEIGQVAIAHVTLNRAHRNAKRVSSVVLAPHQFSWVESEVGLPNDTDALLVALRSSLIAAVGYDFTLGATHYHAITVHPYWADGMDFVTQIGNHKFYRED
jgi:N-acetylmuramoyl-L-alanine amidase